MAASVPAAGAGARGHRSQRPSAAQPLSHLARCCCTASRIKQPLPECSSSKGRGEGSGGEERRGGEGGTTEKQQREEGGGRELAACWHPKEEHVCSWLAAWGQRLSRVRARSHTHTHTPT